MSYEARLIGLLKRRVRVWQTALHNHASRRPLTGDRGMVISLTSFGTRVATAALALESLAMGRCSSESVVLWLDRALEKKPLPRSLERLLARGLSVRYVEDFKSHKKYFFALRTCIDANLPLVTIDDDFLYPRWFTERLSEVAKQSPDSILCYRAKEMMFDVSGGLAPYNEWPLATSRTPSARIFFTSGGGTLMPPAFLKALDAAGDRFLTCCPDADDVWLNSVASRAGVEKRLVLDHSIDFTPLDVPKAQTLWAVNSLGGNDRQLRATYDRELLDELSKCA